VKYQFMNSSTERFREQIAKSTYLQIAMSDYFIPKMRYAYTYVSPDNNLNPIRWETILEESGNVSSLYFMAKGRSWNEKNKTIFKNAYSQFVKAETFLTKTWHMDSHSQLVGHLNAGYMYYFGNSNAAPFSESFYVGGANSIRAFTVRSIGPGSFPITNSGRELSYAMQNGNIKFQANLEYRRRLFGNLYGAVFLDAGNVWNSNSDLYSLSMDDFEYEPEEEELVREIVDIWNDQVADTKFKPRKFLKQLATGTGVGLRYDLDFLVVRVDWGLGLHLPYETEKSGYFNIPSFRDMHSLHLAIGYPF
jgi:outer membrane translocation and assembly module TamA